MSRNFVDPPALVRKADSLEALAKRVSEREKRSRKDQLEHVKKQAADVLAARQQAKRGQWGPWCEKAGLSQQGAWMYAEFGKSLVTSGFSALSEDEQWAEWQRISGNSPSEDEDAEEREGSETSDDSPDEKGSEENVNEAGEASDSEDKADPEEAPTPSYITLDAWNALSAAERKKALKPSGTSKFNDQGDNENIEWALWSWNPVTGCLHNCPYCYARDIAERFYEQKFAPSIVPSRLRAPKNTPFPVAKAAQWVGHKNVFTCSMADLFGRWVPAEWIEAVLEAVRDAPQWNFLFLTKFPVRMAEFDFPENAWVGTSVDCQARVANAEKSFRKVKAGVKWLSCEPLIEPLKFSDLGAFDWVVLGGSSRSSQTPEWHPPRRWVYDIEAQANKAGVRVYEKSNLWQRVRQYPGVEPQPEPKQAPDSLRYLPTPEKS